MKKLILSVISMLIVSANCVLADELYPQQITFDGDKVKWENNGEAELERLSENTGWTNVYTGSDGEYTDTPPEGLSYYRVKNSGEDEWRYSYGKFSGADAECIYGWQSYTGNSSGNLEYTSGKTESGTYKIVKLSSYASNDYAGISQLIDPTKLEGGKSYTLSFDHTRKGGTTSYNQIYYSLGGTRTAISPSKGQTVGWKTTTKTFTYNAGTDFELCFYIVGVGASIELDNIMLYDSSDESKTNLIVNGDFETESQVPDTPENVRILTDDQVLTWKSDFGIVITDGITDYPIAIFSSEKFMEKPDTRSRAYIIRAYTGADSMSEPYLLSSDNESFIAEPSFTAKSAEGTVGVKTKVRNADKQDGLATGLYTALYRNGILHSVSGINRVVPYTGNDDSFTVIRTDINIPDDDAEYELKAFVWGGTDTLTPLTATRKLNR